MIEDGVLSKLMIECGGINSYALTEEGLLFGWGQNQWNQVNRGDTKPVLKPFLMSEDVSELFLPAFTFSLEQIEERLDSVAKTLHGSLDWKHLKCQ